MKTRSAMQVTRFLQLVAFLVLGLDITVTKADQSQFVNAKVETRTVSQSLATTVTQVAADSQQPVWIAYEVEGMLENHSLCCGNYHRGGQDSICGICSLEQQHGDS